MSDYIPLKCYFGAQTARELGAAIVSIHSPFPTERFEKNVKERVDGLELKARVAVIAEELREFLPADYPTAIGILIATLGPEITPEQGMFNAGHTLMPVAYFIECYGLDHAEISFAAIREVTKRNTGEYAIRPFLRRYPERTLNVMRQWAQDLSENVRRLASEGMRPRLPWATRLTAFVEDPSPVLEILEGLRCDTSRFVQKSVANNLNDIAKDHPDRVLDIAQRWMNERHDETSWIVRHALRTLLKKGNPRAMRILGFRPNVDIEVSPLVLAADSVQEGGSIAFRTSLKNLESICAPVLVDYVVHYVKSSGERKKAVFKLNTLMLEPGKNVTVEGNHSFRKVKTRQLYSGRHRIDVQVNGRMVVGCEFTLRC